MKVRRVATVNKIVVLVSSQNLINTQAIIKNNTVTCENDLPIWIHLFEVSGNIDIKSCNKFYQVHIY